MMLRHHRRAFSMMELLLALAMVAALMLSLYASVRVAVRARRSAGAAVAPVRAATIAMDMICRDLESVPPPKGILAGPFLGARQTGATGEAGYLQFYCLGAEGSDPQLPVREGMRQVELMLLTNVTPQVLVRRVTWNLLANAQVVPEDEILCQGVRSFAVQYFDGMYWQTEWDSTSVGDVLPMAVRIQLEMEPAGGGADALPNRIVRIVPLACAEPIDTTGEEETSSGTGSTSGTGTTGGGR
jgi:type II secretion system protein J